MSEPYIRLKNICKSFGTVQANKNVSIDVSKGEILALLGENGSGKSTLVNMLSGIYTPDSGEIEIGGKNVVFRSPKDAINAGIGMIHQHFKLIDVLTAAENIVIGQENSVVLSKKKMNARINELSQKYGISIDPDKKVYNMSVSEKQSVEIMKILYRGADVLILDEPTSYLDIRHKLELLAILKKMVLEKQMTVIMSLHELDLAQKISDQVICVHGDHIEKYGAPEEIFTSDYIRKLYGITRGSYNAEFGCVEMEPPAGKPEVFVIGGNGSGIPVYRKLQRQGIPFVTGVLHTNDADYQVAKELAAKVITEKPFECISESAFEEALEFLGKCEKVYCPLKDFGIMNEKNRELLKKAKETGKLNQIR